MVCIFVCHRIMHHSPRCHHLGELPDLKAMFDDLTVISACKVAHTKVIEAIALCSHCCFLVCTSLLPFTLHVVLANIASKDCSQVLRQMFTLTAISGPGWLARAALLLVV